MSLEEHSKEQSAQQRGTDNNWHPDAQEIALEFMHEGVELAAPIFERI
jgi:hypothetical protein